MKKLIALHFVPRFCPLCFNLLNDVQILKMVLVPQIGDFAFLFHNTLYASFFVVCFYYPLKVVNICSYSLTFSTFFCSLLGTGVCWLNVGKFICRRGV